MESDSTRSRRSLKIVRVLCDGCEKASAISYCTECNESACQTCQDQLHVRGRRLSKKAVARTCNGRSMKDLQRAVGVLPLCTACRSRPAYRYSNEEVYGLCDQCRTSSKPPLATPAADVVKRVIADEIRRSPSKSNIPTSSTTPSQPSRRRHKQKTHHSRDKSRRDKHNHHQDDSTGDDLTNAFSRESSTE